MASQRFISKDMIKEEFIETNKKEVKLGIKLSVIFFLICSLGVYGIFMLEFIQDAIFYLYCVFLSIMAIFLFLGLYFILDGIVSPKKIKKHGFQIITDKVVRLEEKYVKENKRYRVKHLLYFNKYGEKEVDSDRFKMTSLGEEFYLVIFPWKKHSIYSCYPTKLYKYID